MKVGEIIVAGFILLTYAFNCRISLKFNEQQSK